MSHNDAARSHGHTTPGFQSLPRPIAFVFTSGGARCAAQVGMMKALTDTGLRPDLITSASFGSINAATYAAVDHSDYTWVSGPLAALWELIKTESTFQSPGAAIARRLMVSRGNRASKEMREIIALCVPDQPLSELATPLTPVATDLATGDHVSLDHGSTLDAVVASCAIPILLKPVTIGDKTLFDGGFTQCAPLQQALDRGARSIVMLDAGASTVPEAHLSQLRWWEVAATAYDHLMRGQVGHALADAAKQVPVITLTTDHGKVFDFSDPDGMMEAGYESANETIRKLGPVLQPGVYNVPLGFTDYAPIQDMIRPPA